MGACGCGDFRGDVKFKGPDGTWYILKLYPSCIYCDTPAGITLYKFSEEEMKDWAADELPEIDIPYVGKGFEVIHPRILREHLIEAKLYEEDYGDDFYHEFQEAVWETHKQENKGEGS